MKTVIIIVLLLLSSCNIIDIKEFSSNTNIETYDQIIDNERIYVSFTHKVKKSDAESIIKISNFFTEDVVKIDYFWEGDKKVYLQPVAPLKKGVRYSLEVNGKIKLQDGTSEKIIISETFYYKSLPLYLQLKTFTPLNNTSIGVFDKISFTFDNAIDKNDFEKNLILTPNTEVLYAWNSALTKVTIEPKDKWQQYTHYSWKIPRSITENIDIDILNEFSGAFLVQNEQTHPLIESITSGVYEDNIYTANAFNLNGIDYNSTIEFNFNNNIDETSLKAAFSITPDIDGEIKPITLNRWLFIPNENWKQGTEYKLEFSEDLEDIYGNFILNKDVYYFKPERIIPISIDSIALDSVENPNPTPTLISTFNDNIEHEIVIGAPPESDLQITITFAEGSFTTDISKENFINSISFEGYFPKATSHTLTSVLWPNPRIVILHYRKLHSGGDFPWSKQTYKFLLKSGYEYRNQVGSYIKEDKYVIIKTK